MRKPLLAVGLLLLFAAEILHVYLLMPFPGSQLYDTGDLAYFLNNNIFWIRIVAILMIVYPVWFVFARQSRWKKIRVSLLLLAYIVLAVSLNLSNTYGKNVLPISALHFTDSSGNKNPADKLVMGVVINGRAKAYPIDIISYHQQVQDTFGLVKVLITYSAASRTGRVYSSFVDLLAEFLDLKIIGMNEFNALMEDDNTKSWWHQATGEVMAGPLKGHVLKKLPSEQMTLSAWLRRHPGSIIMQPDSAYVEKAEKMRRNAMISTDKGSWQPRSLVIGVEYLDYAKAYDWNQLISQRIMQDSLPLYPILIRIEKDDVSFHVYNRFAMGRSLHFIKNANDDMITDSETGSFWNIDGKCVEGPLAGNQLGVVQASQEFWRSWKRFHPETTRYN